MPKLKQINDDISYRKYFTKDLYKYYLLSGGDLTEKQFTDVITLNHEKISGLINNGYHYHIPYDIGLIKVVTNKRKIKLKDNGNIVGAVDWGTSNKLKAEILARGGIPYKEEKDDKGIRISDNGGEKWLCYHIDDTYNIWVKISSVSLKNAMNYNFKPSWTNARSLAKVDKEVSDLSFNKRKSDGTSRSHLFAILAAKDRTNV